MTIEHWFLDHGESAQYLIYLALLLGLALMEVRWPGRRQAAPKGRRWRANFAITALNVVVLGALPLSFITAAHWGEERSLGLLHGADLPLAALVLLGLLGRGFISWITHLLMHKVPLFWRVHHVHHTDTELDVSTTVRFHPLEFPIQLAIGLPFILVLGISPWVLLAYEVADAAITVFSHANIALPPSLERWLRYLIVTPGLHRVHHSTIPAETDSNFSAVFPVWDLVFGTFRTETEVPDLEMALGLEEVRDERTRSLGWLLAAPFRFRQRTHSLRVLLDKQ